MTPTPYGVQEFAQVRDILARKNAAAECPACGSAFALGRPRPRGNEVVRQVRCLGCGRTAVVTNTWAARVLVVEANDVVRDTLRAILTGDGHDVVEAADAAVGLQAFRVTPSDVVFVDVLASGRMEAADFVRRLRREFPDARVVALSRRPSYGVTDRGAVTTQLGAVRTIRMPFSRAEVLEAVAEARR